MKYFDFTFPNPAENLAADDALMDLCDKGLEDEILRVWEPQTPFVVLGYANHATREVNLDACQKAKIPVFRRCSGGGTVVQGPGCLNYSLILKIAPGPLNSIAGTNQFILGRNVEALASLLDAKPEVEGHTDLALRNLKFSGNAQRRLKNALIFHGSFLLDFDISLIEKLLPLPSKQPCYRENRSHSEFLTNLKIPPTELKSALRKNWSADEPLRNIPTEKIQELVSARYSRDEWNLKF
jgi:lipoate---protein ligase